MDDREQVFWQGAKGTVGIIDVTPEVADAWLDLAHEKQRRTRRASVEKIERDLIGGRFHWQGDAFVFNRDNRLVDGQHRCLAVIRSGMTLREQIVVRVLSDEPVIETIDLGRRTRSVHQAIGMQYGSSPGSQIISALVFAETGERSGRVSRPEQVTLVSKADPELVESLKLVEKASRKFIGAPTGLLHAAAACMKVSKDAEVFFCHVASNDPVIDGRRWEAISRAVAVLVKAKGSAGENPRFAVIEKLIRAWNAYRSGEDARLLRSTGNTPDPLP